MQLSDAPSPPMSPVTPSSSISYPRVPSSSAISQQSSSSLSYSPTLSYQEPSRTASSSSLSSTSNIMYPSVSSFHSTRPLISHSAPHFAPPIVNPIAGTDSSGPFSRGDDGMWSKTLTLQWPAAKSNSRWTIGETIQSDLISVRFFIRVKVARFIYIQMVN